MLGEPFRVTQGNDSDLVAAWGDHTVKPILGRPRVHPEGDGDFGGPQSAGAEVCRRPIWKAPLIAVKVEAPCERVFAKGLPRHCGLAGCSLVSSHMEGMT
jgi:hypothetical protein